MLNYDKRIARLEVKINSLNKSSFEKKCLADEFYQAKLMSLLTEEELSSISDETDESKLFAKLDHLCEKYDYQISRLNLTLQEKERYMLIESRIKTLSEDQIKVIRKEKQSPVAEQIWDYVFDGKPLTE